MCMEAGSGRITKNTKGNLNKWRENTMFPEGRTNTEWMSVLPKLIYKFCAILAKKG